MVESGTHRVFDEADRMLYMSIHGLAGVSNYRSKLSEVLTAVNASENYETSTQILPKTITEAERTLAAGHSVLMRILRKIIMEVEQDGELLGKKNI